MCPLKLRECNAVLRPLRADMSTECNVDTKKLPEIRRGKDSGKDQKIVGQMRDKKQEWVMEYRSEK